MTQDRCSANQSRLAATVPQLHRIVRHVQMANTAANTLRLASIAQKGTIVPVESSTLVPLGNIVHQDQVLIRLALLVRSAIKPDRIVSFSVPLAPTAPLLLDQLPQLLQLMSTTSMCKERPLTHRTNAVMATFVWVAPPVHMTLLAPPTLYHY